MTFDSVKCFSVRGVFLVAVCVFLTSPAAAELKICNQTEDRLGVALGYGKAEGWASEGWWNMEPNKCTRVVKNALSSRYFYLHVVNYDNGRERWSGKHVLCTHKKLFKIDGSGGCEARGYKPRGFIEVDTLDAAALTVALGKDKQVQTVSRAGANAAKPHTLRVQPTD